MPPQPHPRTNAAFTTPIITQCDIAVHQACYDIHSVPKGKWFCDVCALGEKPQDTACVLCPLRDGAFQSVNSDSGVKEGRRTMRLVASVGRADSQWVHTQCGIWVTEAYYDTTRRAWNLHKAPSSLRRTSIIYCPPQDLTSMLPVGY